MLFFHIQLSHHKRLYHLPKGSWKQARIIPVGSYKHSHLSSVFNYLPSDSSATPSVSAWTLPRTLKNSVHQLHTLTYDEQPPSTFSEQGTTGKGKRENIYFTYPKYFWFQSYLGYFIWRDAEETTATFSGWQIIVSLYGLDNHDCTGVQFKTKRICSRYLHHLRI